MEKLLHLVGLHFLETWLPPGEASKMWTTNAMAYHLVEKLPAVAAFAQSRIPLVGAHLKPQSLGEWTDLYRACVAAVNEDSLRC